MKKFLGAVLAFSLAITSVFSHNPATVDGETVINPNINPTVYNISLEDAINMAFENNVQIEANLLKQKGNEISASSARMLKREYKDMVINVSTNFEAYCLKNGYYVKAAEMAHRISQKENEKIRANISYNVTEAYYNVLLMKKLVNAAENSYKLALDNQKAVDAQFSLGLIPELDYENAGITVTICENTLNEYKLNYEIAEHNLKILLHKDTENCTLVLTDEIECEDFESDFEKDIASAMETRFDLYSLKENRNLAEEYFNCARVTGEGAATYNTAYASYIEADYNYTNTKKLIGLSVKSAYNKIITTKANMETARMQYEIDLKEYDATKLKYELGMIANLELTKCINDLYTSQVNYANAKLGYRLAVEKYKYEITIGL